MDSQIRYNLHNHTTYSDGELTPAEVVRFNKASGFNVIAITDHETIDGIQEAIKEGKKQGVLVIPGVEIQTENTHMLGLFINPSNSELKQFLKKMQDAQLKQQEETIKILTKQGFLLSKSMIRKFTKSRILSPNRISKCLVHFGLMPNQMEARKIVDQIQTQPKTPLIKVLETEAIKIIKKSGGEAVWAHPMSHKRSKLNFFKVPFRAMVLKRAGLSGLEIEHPEQTKLEQQFLKILAKSIFLNHSGGADFHDPKGKEMTQWQRKKQTNKVRKFIKKNQYKL